MIPGDRLAYPGTQVLVNKYDLRDREKLARIEYVFSLARLVELDEHPIPGNFDLAHLQAIHRHLLQDVYEWAGSLREVDIAKRSASTKMVSRFTLAVLIPDQAAKLEAFLHQHNYLRNLSKNDFVNGLAEVFGILNEMHPFREGSGRVMKAYLGQLAKEAGYHLDFAAIDKLRWNDAAARTMKQDHPTDPAHFIPACTLAMRSVFFDIATPTKAHALRHEAESVALHWYPDLQDVYAKMPAIVETAKRLFPNDAERQRRVIDEAQTRLLSGNGATNSVGASSVRGRFIRQAMSENKIAGDSNAVSLIKSVGEALAAAKARGVTAPPIDMPGTGGKR